MHSKPYQAAVGSLNHAAVMTRPDISKAVQTVAQFASNPGKHTGMQLSALFATLRPQEIGFNSSGKSAPMELIGYCDADHANSPDHGRPFRIRNGTWQRLLLLVIQEADCHCTLHR